MCWKEISLKFERLSYLYLEILVRNRESKKKTRAGLRDERKEKRTVPNCHTCVGGCPKGRQKRIRLVFVLNGNPARKKGCCRTGDSRAGRESVALANKEERHRSALLHKPSLLLIASDNCKPVYRVRRQRCKREPCISVTKGGVADSGQVPGPDGGSDRLHALCFTSSSSKSSFAFLLGWSSTGGSFERPLFVAVVRGARVVP